MEAIINYKKRIASRFIPLEGSSVVNDLPESDEYIYSEKIDGHIAFAVVNDGKVALYNRSANILDLPHIIKAFPANASGIWAGELYLPKDRSRSFQVSSAIANNKEELRFAVFDAVHESDKQADDRTETVKSNIPNGDIVHPMQWQKTNSRKELLNKYHKAIESGKEGLVVHNTLGYTYKLKPSVELDMAVIGYSMKEDGSGIRALLVGLNDGDGWVVIASVGGGFNDESRVDWLNKLQLLECESDIVLVANNKLAYKWVQPSITIQIKCIEIIPEDGTGQIKKEKMSYANGSYTFVKKTNACSLISPVFLGVRADKIAGPDDTGISQITSRVEINQDSISDSDEKAISQIIFREVYIKESKTGTAVRKFTGLKTNRNLDQSFAPYILFYTDFSAGRKEPLQTDIKIAADQISLNNLLQKAIEDNVKKGWEKVV
jgi:hypothetical protein